MIEASNITPQQIHQSLLDRLGEFRAQVRQRLLLEGVIKLLLAMLGVAVVTFALDRCFRLSLPARVSMLVFGAVALLIFAWRAVIAPLLLKLDPLTLASALDRMAGTQIITARVASVLELPRQMKEANHPSLPMLMLAAQQCHSALSEIEFDSRLSDHRRNWAFAGLLAVILFPLLFAGTEPQATRLWAARLFAGSNQPWPQRTYLSVSDLTGDEIVVPRGEAFVLRVSAKDNSEVPEVVSLRFREPGAARVEPNLTSFGHNDFRYEFSSITAPIQVEVSGGDDSLGPFLLRPADRPKIADLKLIAQHPTESSPTTFNFSGDSDLSFLPRTHVQLLFAANTPVAEAHIKSSTTQPSQADLKQIDDTHFSMDWTHNANVQMEIELISRDAHLASAATTLTVGLKIDQPPRVTIGYSGVKLRVTSKARIPLSIDARDDYGVANVELANRTESPEAGPGPTAKMAVHATTQPLFGPMKPAHELEIQPKYELDLEPMKLPIGTQVTVTASATDDCYLGPQKTVSRPITFRVVAPEELFREILLRQQAERARFRKQADEVQAMRGAMNLATSTDAITALARRHRAMQHEVNRINTALAETLTEMRLNQLGTDEAYDLMQKNVLTPMQRFNADLLTPQKDALDALSPTDGAGLAAVEARQDEEYKAMLDILHQMSQWDSFVDVLNQLNEIIKQQDQAEQKTKELKKKETEGIFEK
jgi:hypothetical protein